MWIRVWLAVSFMGLLMTPARAWNNFGHMEAAAVAWNQLTPAAKSEATRLLKLNPQYDEARLGRLRESRYLAGRDQVA